MHVWGVVNPLVLAIIIVGVGVGVNWNWNWNWNRNWEWVVQLMVSGVIVALGFHRLLRSTTSNYFLLHHHHHHNPNLNSSSSSSSMSMPNNSCAVCAKPTSKQCAACKILKYCSQQCQSKHWNSEHKKTCKQLQLSGTLRSPQGPAHAKHNSSNAPVPPSGSKKLVDKVLFPYDDFVKLFNWDKQIFPPCGLLNCGNSCFANVTLQCLAHTRPLVAYLLDKGHRRDCRRNGWCFLCELQTHMERASRSQQPFSPINILSRLPSIGGNLGYGKQEDAHEFMRFAIDTMQSVCLDEHGGENAIHPKSQETTLIQHIFGGQLRSQVVCTQCNQVSNQYENMMDLTVEIQGDAISLEECLNRFTMEERLHGDNMYKCDGCNDYVSAWKRLTIHQAPNILTIALKRFQSGRFGKINKRITFPEDLDLSPYTSEGRNGTDIYKLYAVVVHLDMLNASFFGHYVCYTKGFQGDWYRIDDCKVSQVELNEVLSQGAYMLMYSRVSARPVCLKTVESATKLAQKDDKASIGTEVEHRFLVHLANSSKVTDPDSNEQLGITVSVKEELYEVDLGSVTEGEGSQSVDQIAGLPAPVGTLESAINSVEHAGESFGVDVDASCDTYSDNNGSGGASMSCESETGGGGSSVNGFPDSEGRFVEHDELEVESCLDGNVENCGGGLNNRVRKEESAGWETKCCEVRCMGSETY